MDPFGSLSPGAGGAVGGVDPGSNDAERMVYNPFLGRLVTQDEWGRYLHERQNASSAPPRSFVGAAMDVADDVLSNSASAIAHDFRSSHDLVTTGVSNIFHIRGEIPLLSIGGAGAFTLPSVPDSESQ